MGFRYKIHFLLLGVLQPLIIFAQSKDSLFTYPDRYKLELPKEWNRHKLIEAITDILPQTIDELKDRDFGTERKAAYMFVWLLIPFL
jgi:hypothetical protein